MEIALFILIILIASILQTSTGFGFSILATPFLLLIFDPAQAIQINIILSLFISIALFMKIRQDIDRLILRRLVLGSLVGLPIGLAIFLVIDMDQLKLGIGLLILALTILLLLRFRIQRSTSRDLLAGGISGALTTNIGMPGPPLLLYFSGTDTGKAKLRGTTLAFYLFAYIVSLVMQVVFAGTDRTIWISSGLALPLVLIGMYLGQLLFHRISQRAFQIFTYVILFFTGAYLIIEYVRGL